MGSPGHWIHTSAMQSTDGRRLSSAGEVADTTVGLAVTENGVITVGSCNHSQEFCQAVRNFQCLWELLHLTGIKGTPDWKNLEFTLKAFINFRNNDRKRAKEYKKELEEMKKRIQRRPYLFEQVTKVNLKYHLFSCLG